MRCALRSTLVVALAACGMLGNGPAAKPRVQAAWQQKLTSELQESRPEATEAWGLFSKGGWADNGQVMVLAEKGGKGAKVLIVEPTKREVTSQRHLSQAELEAFKAKVAPATSLKDFKANAMDAIEYEYVHVVKASDGKAAVKERVFYGTGTNPVPAHDALVAAFLDLRKPQAKR